MHLLFMWIFLSLKVVNHKSIISLILIVPISRFKKF